MSDPLFLRFGREFRAGDVLFREGERGEEMYVIQSGVVQILKRVGDESSARSRRWGAASSSARWQSSTTSRARRRPSWSRTPSAWSSTATTLEQMIANNTEIALRLVKKLARRLDSADEMIQILLNPDPKARVMLGLKRHAEAFGEDTGLDGVRAHIARPTWRARSAWNEAQVREVLARLRRLRIACEDEMGAIVVVDVAAPARVHGVPRDAAQVRGVG